MHEIHNGQKTSLLLALPLPPPLEASEEANLQVHKGMCAIQECAMEKMQEDWTQVSQIQVAQTQVLCKKGEEMHKNCIQTWQEEVLRCIRQTKVQDVQKVLQERMLDVEAQTSPSQAQASSSQNEQASGAYEASHFKVTQQTASRFSIGES